MQAVTSFPSLGEVSVSLEFMPILVVDLCSRAYTHLNQLRLAAIFGHVCVDIASVTGDD